jgi:nucleotide sugar dehydrogenase
MKIGVIGMNDVSVAFSLLCEKAGYVVIISDEREDVVFNFNKEIYTTKEPLIQKMLFESDDISATTDVIELIESCGTIFTFVDTPPTINGDNDTKNVFEVVNHFFTASQLDKTIHSKKFIIGTTMNPGEVEQIQQKLNMFNIQVGYNPHMSSEGSIVTDFENSDIVLIGTEYGEVSSELIKIYTKLQLKTVNAFVMSTKAAEVTKLSINSYLASKISFANTLGNLLIKSGLQEESGLIFKTMENDSRIGEGYFKHGFGYGGSNLPRDLNSLANYSKNFDINTTLLDSIKESNNKHHEFLKSYYTSQNPNKSVPFVFKNIGFKKGSENLIDSQPYKLCIELLEEGYHINLINDSSSKNDLTKLSESYDGRLKLYKKGTSPEGFLINL